MVRRVDWQTPFARLAVAHAAGVGGESLLAITLAGSLFFKTDPAQGRAKVLLGLMLTIAPFAIVGPLIGPMIDRVRGGLRAVIISTMAVRAVVAVSMIFAIRADSLALFPEAFVMLVAGKTYQVAKAAVVPTTVESDDELVEANSKLQLLSGLAAPVFGVVGGAFLWVGGSASVAVLVMLTFIVATVLSFGVPAPEPSGEESPAERAGRLELRSTAVVTTATAMAIIRGIVGFVTFLLAFSLRGVDYRLPGVEVLARNVSRALPFLEKGVIRPAAGPPPPWHFGAVIGASLVGGLIGAAIAPRLRRMLAEERILAGALGLIILCAIGALLTGGLIGSLILAFFVAIAAGGGKQAFDAIVQRDAPDADRGRVRALRSTVPAGVGGGCPDPRRAAAERPGRFGDGVRGGHRRWSGLRRQPALARRVGSGGAEPTGSAPSTSCRRGKRAADERASGGQKSG